MPVLPDLRNRSQTPQESRRAAEYSVRTPGRSPQLRVLHKIRINYRRQRIPVPDGRHAPYGEAGRAADKTRVGLPNLLAEDVAHLLLIHSVAAAGKHKDRLCRCRLAEYQLLYDLRCVAAECLGRLGGGARGKRKLPRLEAGSGLFKRATYGPRAPLSHAT